MAAVKKNPFVIPGSKTSDKMPTKAPAKKTPAKKGKC